MCEFDTIRFVNRRDFLLGAAGIATMPSLLRAQDAPPVKTVRTSILEIAYHEYGPASGLPVILLHGFPDDAHAYDGVGPVLANAGHRAHTSAIRACILPEKSNGTFDSVSRFAR